MLKSNLKKPLDQLGLSTHSQPLFSSRVPIQPWQKYQSMLDNKLYHITVVDSFSLQLSILFMTRTKVENVTMTKIL